MFNANDSTYLAAELEKDAANYVSQLKGLLTGSRLMVWTIIQNKKFVGFTDAQNLIKAYDHLNKVLSIFEAYQLPLPEKEEEAPKKADKRQAALVAK
jgi:hypothetical protein